MSMDWEIEELAYRAMGKTEEEMEDAVNNGDIDEALFEKYEVSFDQYCTIVEDLLPFTPKLEYALSGTKSHAFIDCEEGRAIVKLEAMIISNGKNNS